MSEGVYREQNQRLCALLRAQRQKAQLRQEDLAQMIGRNQSFITRYEKGQKNVDVVEFLAICSALNCDPHKLLNELLDRTG